MIKHSKLPVVEFILFSEEDNHTEALVGIIDGIVVDDIISDIDLNDSESEKDVYESELLDVDK